MSQITLELSLDEARFLAKHLARHIGEVNDELVHTDKREMQHALAQDLAHLEIIERRLAALLVARRE